MSYRDTCPKQVITQVHHTIATWPPVTLACGHVEKINWTAKEGQSIGCIACNETAAKEARMQQFHENVAHGLYEVG